MVSLLALRMFRLRTGEAWGRSGLPFLLLNLTALKRGLTFLGKIKFFCPIIGGIFKYLTIFPTGISPPLSGSVRVEVLHSTKQYKTSNVGD